MITKHDSRLSIVIALFLMISSTYAGRELTIAYHEQFPEIYTGKGGVVEGRMAENLKAAFQKVGYTVKFKSLPLKRIYYSLIRGKVDAWYGTTTVTHLQGETLNSENLTELNLRAYFIGDKPKLGENEAEFLKKKVITLLGESYGTLGGFLRDSSNSVDLMEVKTYEQGFKALSVGRKDYLIAYKGSLEDLSNLTSSVDLKYTEIGIVNFSLVCSEEIEDTSEVISDFNKAWKELKSSGSLK